MVERLVTAMLKPGLYEQLIDGELRRELETIPSARKATMMVDPAEAAEVLSRYIAEETKKALSLIEEEHGKVEKQVELVNRILHLLPKRADSDIDGEPRLLVEFLSEKDAALSLGRKAGDTLRPETSIAISSLLTGAEHEPAMFTELKKEIASADRIDMLVSFIKWSGLVLILDELKDSVGREGELRIITTSYMGATDMKAVEELAALSHTKVKISYDTERTRLHAKTYIFYRNTGFTTAYVGSSNLSNAAISSGLEWNVKVTAKDLPFVMRKMEATFESYWNSDEFELYSPEKHDRLYEALGSERGSREQPKYLFDIRPYPYQQAILDKLLAEREVRHSFRNLVVAATGTGKTVIAAFDYRRFRRQYQGSPCRLLFIAHREEILRQSQATFAGILKDPNFGELYVGGHRPEKLDYLFISIQTLNSQALDEHLPADYYDYLVLDESHHAAAASYSRALEYFRPKVLLGLTATPERLDGENITHFFDSHIAAEIRLPEAINRKLLCPFHYFGVSDTVDLDDLKWTRGGYDRNALDSLYTFTYEVAKKRADHILRSLYRYVADINDVRALGFCVSKAHASFMADYFNECGVPALALTSESGDEERDSAQKKLVGGELRILFVVDLYNEGVDIPEVNTVLFLRPTESLTIFLQQLGRGLRLAEGKECLTVLDFIGAANRKYRFEEKFAAMLDMANHSVEYELKKGFVSVPKGCYIQLEQKASKIILENIRQSYNGREKLVERIASFEEDSNLPLTLENFLTYYHMDVRRIYAKYSFASLCVLAGVREDFHEPMESDLLKPYSRLCAIDSRRWIGFLLDILPRLREVDFLSLEGNQKRMLNMFFVTVWQKAMEECSPEDVKKKLEQLAASPVLLAELMELLQYKLNHIDFIDAPVDLPYECPLDVHCSYTRDQLFVGLDFTRPSTVREGVKWLPEKHTDVLLITLNKSDKEYSPTTMYNDYSINSRTFHWQSQSTTSADSPTGKRYMDKDGRDGENHVLLFVRETKKDICGTAPYTFLGTAFCSSHSGSRPINITWKLHYEIPAKYLRKTQQVIG